MDAVHSFTGVEVKTCSYENVYEIFKESFSTSSKEGKLMEIDGSVCCYSELNTHISKLVKMFQDLQLQKGSIVALFIPNGIKRISTMLALIRSGIIFFPIDPLLPKETINAVLEQGEPVYVLITKENGYAEMWASFKLNWECISLDDWTIYSEEDVPYVVTADTSHDDVLCIVFTSGSSGKPKGVRLTQGNFINRLTWYYREFPYKGNEILCSKTNILMLDFYFETLCPILKHMTCVFVKQHHYEDVSRFMSILKNEKISRLVLVPSLLRCLCSFTAEDRSLISLDHVVCSGETLSYDLANEFLSKYPEVSLYNLYGSTETTADVLYAKFDVNAVTSGNNSVIGFPLQNTKIYVVKESDDEYADHPKRGELWVSGLNVTAGYVKHNEEENAFLPNPFEETNDSIYCNLFKTGDIVEVTNNGIEFVGRKDDFVKVRGHKVNLKVVEDTIKECFPRRQVRVLSKFSYSKSQMQLYAFVESTESISQSNAHQRMKDLIPSYMVPRIIEICKMPLTPTGKIDRQALLSNYTTDRIKALTEEEVTRFKNEEEKILYATSKVLDLSTEEVDFSKSFFQLGGNSITSFLFLYELKQLGIFISPQKLLQAKSLDDLSSRGSVDFTCLDDNEISIVPFTDLSRGEVEYTALKLNETFTNEDAIARPYYSSIRLDNCVRQCMEKCPSLGMAAKFGNQIAGAVVNSPLDIDIYYLSNTHEEIVSLFSFAKKDVMIKLHAEKHAILESDLMFADVTLPAGLGTKVLYLLSKEVIKIAKRDRYTAIVTIDTNPATQHVDVDFLGFVTESIVYPKRFCMNGKYPFAHMDKDYIIMVNVKYL